MNKNKLIIAAAGSGKTTYLVEQAKKIKDANVLITTYTEANETEIRKKFKGCIPRNVTIQTWFSFLLQHGVRPYQSKMNDNLHDKKIGFYLSKKKSGFRFNNKGRPGYWGENTFDKYYFTESLKIYSDKTSKFIYECNKKTNNEIITRIARIYHHIYIDEIQDLAGWELEILKLLFNSESQILLVGDPRQVVYLTHHSGKHPGYKDGKIKEFIENECNTKKKIICFIDETTLQKSHRNNKLICDFSSALYPNYAASEPCDCEECRKETPEHQGVFLVKPNEIEEYCKKYSPIILKEKLAVYPEWNYGKSKGLSFDRVLIYPTEKIREYLIKGDITDIQTIKAKFYVALTRARYSVGIIYNYDEKANYIEGLEKHEVESEYDKN